MEVHHHDYSIGRKVVIVFSPQGTTIAAIDGRQGSAESINSFHKMGYTAPICDLLFVHGKTPLRRLGQ